MDSLSSTSLAAVGEDAIERERERPLEAVDFRGFPFEGAFAGLPRFTFGFFRFPETYMTPDMKAKR